KRQTNLFGWVRRGIWRNAMPGIRGADRLTHAYDEFLLGVVILPAAAAVHIGECLAAAIRQVAPFGRETIIRARWLPFRHGTIAKPPIRRHAMVPCGMASSNGRMLVAHNCLHSLWTARCKWRREFGFYRRMR